VIASWSDSVIVVLWEQVDEASLKQGFEINHIFLPLCSESWHNLQKQVSQKDYKALFSPSVYDFSYIGNKLFDWVNGSFKWAFQLKDSVNLNWSMRCYNELEIFRLNFILGGTLRNKIFKCLDKLDCRSDQGQRIPMQLNFNKLMCLSN